MRPARGAIVLVLVAGCAAAPKSPSQEPAAPASAATAEGSSSTPAGYPQATPEPAPSPEPAPVSPADKGAPKQDAPGASRSSVEVRGELDRAQRELDIAGGDCRNACRALGSMDRAAGRLCELARSSDERDRCGEASTKVKTARDKVKRTCGSCPDVTVERDAAIPSR